MLTSSVPDWIVNFIGKAANMFFLNSWTIHARAHDDPSRPEGNESSDGLASFNTRYMTADLYLDTRLEPDAYGCEVVLHEVLHPVFGEMRDTVAQIIARVSNDAFEQLKIQEQYDLAEERLITVLARGMVKQFDMQLWAVEDGAVTAEVGPTDVPEA